MIRECWIVLSAVVWTISVCLVLQYWGTSLRIDEEIINWNYFPTNSTIQKVNSISTRQTSPNVYRSLNSSSKRDFKMYRSKIGPAILSLNSYPSALRKMNLKSTMLTALKRDRSLKSSSKAVHSLIYTQKLSNNLKSTTSSSQNFIYLIQTESCLGDDLLGPGLFGSGCNSHIIVLSWKQPCTSHYSRHLKHIRYIYKANSTWGEGRNVLYHFAKKIPKSYLYYIFMDDDLTFHFTNSASKERYRNLGIRWPLQAFEDFLLEHEPAIGMPLFCSKCFRLNSITGKPETRCCDLMKDLKPLPEYLPVTIHFDAAFNAFHRNAVDLILPYRLELEHWSWWESQKFVILAADFMFRGQVLRFSPVTVLNSLHREYPKLEWKNWARIFITLKVEMPRKYRDQLDWTPDYTVDVIPIVRNNTVFTPTWNMEIPRGKITVEPFKHLSP